jgi:magnesium-transporting ATPase (P-type)
LICHKVISYTYSLLSSFVFLLLTFYYFYQTNISKFIGNLNKKLYIYSALICILGFTIFYIYILIKDDFTKEDIDARISEFVQLVSFDIDLV